MKKQNVPKPDPMPKFHSSTDHRNSEELPGEENLNDQMQDSRNLPTDAPKPDLGNKKNDDEAEREKLIRQ